MEPNAGSMDPEALEKELKQWNWGGFFLTWIWGIGNSTYVALLGLIPLVQFVMMIVLGAKGNRWAWKNREWKSLEHFRHTQRQWALWGGVIVVGFVIFFGAIFFGVTGILKNTEPYKASLSLVEKDERIAASIGTPIKAGFWVTGSVNVSGAEGYANLAYKVTGPKDAATVYVQAYQEAGKWEYELVGVEIDDTKERIQLK